MDENDLVTGTKKRLLLKISALKPIHGRKWRSLLKRRNPWHGTDKGLSAWNNMRIGTTGNEALRLILEDMEAIAAEDVPDKVNLPDPQLRESMITESIQNLQRSKRQFKLSKQTQSVRKQ